MSVQCFDMRSACEKFDCFAVNRSVAIKVLGLGDMAKNVITITFFISVDTVDTVMCHGMSHFWRP